jgi:hypothetical protein
MHGGEVWAEVSRERGERLRLRPGSRDGEGSRGRAVAGVNVGQRRAVEELEV